MTLYIDDAVWERIQELVRLGYAKNASQLVNELLTESLAKFSKSGKLSSVSYEALKLRHLTLAQNVIRLQNKLKRAYGPEYRELLSLIRSLGLEFETFSNLSVVAPQLISRWKGHPTPLHLFITLLVQSKEKREIERKLSELRKRMFPANSRPIA